jgi:methyl-accepting chemotaxis protein
MNAENNGVLKISRAGVVFRLIVATSIFPLLFLIIDQQYTAIFNPNITADMYERITRHAIRPLTFAIFFAALILANIIVLRKAKPLLNFIKDGSDYEKARKVTLDIPWILMCLHFGLWIVGVLAFYIIVKFQPPGGIPFSWAIFSLTGAGLMGAIYSILVINNILMKPKRLLNMTSIKDKENDLFVRYKFFIMFFAIIYYTTVHLMYLAYFYFKAPPEVLTMFDFRTSILVVGGVITVLCFLPIVISQAGYNYQINFLKEKLNELVRGEGDLTKRLILLNFDEIGDVCRDINGFLDFLSGFISTVKEVSETTANTSAMLEKAVSEYEEFFGEFAEFMKEMIEGIHSQQSEVGTARLHTTDIMESLNKYMQNIIEQGKAVEKTSSAINQMVNSIANTLEMAHKTHEISGTLTDKTNRSSGELNRVFESIKSVHASSGTVLQITQSISEIAETTNVLALNASIEASHAGVAGKGFAVVANEIKKLAHQTGESAYDIVKHINEMGVKIDNGMEVVNMLKESMESMFPLIKEIITQLMSISEHMTEDKDSADHIVDEVRVLVDASQKMNEIAEAQRNRSRDIERIMEELNKVSEHTYKLVGSIEEKIERMNRNNIEIRQISGVNIDNAKRLSEITGKFKT